MAGAGVTPSRGRFLLRLLLGLVGLALLGILLGKEQKRQQTSQTETAAANAAAADVLQQAIAAMPRERTWQDIRVDKAEPDGGMFTLVYKKSDTDPPLAVVERDTTTIGRAILKPLLAAGRQPKDLSIWVSAQMPGGTGETGQQLVRPYGHVAYNYGRTRSSSSDSQCPRRVAHVVRDAGRRERHVPTPAPARSPLPPAIAEPLQRDGERQAPAGG